MAPLHMVVPGTSQPRLAQWGTGLVDRYSGVESRPGLPAEDRLRFETAVIEVANNIVEYATARLADVPEVTIELTLTATADRVTAHFRDDGGPADIDLAGSRMPDVMAEYGRGIALTRALVDEVIYERSGSANIWTVTCQRSDRSQP